MFPGSHEGGGGRPGLHLEKLQYSCFQVQSQISVMSFHVFPLFSIFVPYVFLCAKVTAWFIHDVGSMGTTGKMTNHLISFMLQVGL